jgi:hypothetical protein
VDDALARFVGWVGPGIAPGRLASGQGQTGTKPVAL